MWSEIVQETCWKTWFGMLGRPSEGLVRLSTCYFFEIWERNTHLSAALCKHHLVKLPAPGKRMRISYTGRGTVRRQVCDPYRSRPPDPTQISACHHFSTWQDVFFFFLPLWGKGMTAICKAVPKAISFCFRWVWWEILLLRQCSGFPASFHFFHWAETWGCCTSSQLWTKRTWTINCGSFLCAFLISSAFTGSMRRGIYGPNPESWAVQALSGCVQCMGLSLCCHPDLTSLSWSWRFY